ncbi:four helix bundle protein [Sphingobacterium olei]|uniref:Four helix bundle protein n=1 Tax=Sphingobacterium olei TaxID=2571155 RepID=A0A4V5MMJ1_9SPHI|nr:four helix bundle protein [Sphingobacterium olei]TJZ61078.1 four helix bundle protein [Sphingobacterium olei]
MHNLQELLIWQKAIDLSVHVYKLVADFPNDERYGLSSQLKRSAISIPSNIAEGAGRNSENEFVHFLGIANGSSYELQTQIVIAHKLSFISYEEMNFVCDSVAEIQKMNYGFQNKLRNKK